MERKERISQLIAQLRPMISKLPTQDLTKICDELLKERTANPSLNEEYHGFENAIRWELLNRKNKQGITKETFNTADNLLERIKTALEQDSDIKHQTLDFVAFQKQKAQQTLASRKQPDTMER